MIKIDPKIADTQYPCRHAKRSEEDQRLLERSLKAMKNGGSEPFFTIRLGIDPEWIPSRPIPPLHREFWEIEDLEVRAKALLANTIGDDCEECEALVQSVADASFAGSVLSTRRKTSDYKPIEWPIIKRSRKSRPASPPLPNLFEPDVWIGVEEGPR